MKNKEKVRIICLPATEAEAAINELVDDYAPLVWNIGPIEDQVVITCVLLLESELQKMRAQQAAPATMPINLAGLRGLRS